VANNARGVNATQLNMAGTGIGTFSDRLRDAVRGGGPFDNGNDLVSNQGFISGLYYDPNALNSGSAAEKDKLLLYADQIKVGLAGNLANYTFTNRLGQIVSGSQVDYNGQPAGYTADPQENIVYIEAHDNQTLYDVTQYKMPASATMDERVRAQNVGLSIDCLAQGVPFFHAGSDMLRSKSLDPNSYNSGGSTCSTLPTRTMDGVGGCPLGNRAIGASWNPCWLIQHSSRLTLTSSALCTASKRCWKYATVRLSSACRRLRRSNLTLCSTTTARTKFQA
jgi:hypothetical protein